MSKKGFTLIELSIVIVIVGLLISGVLVGQSLIESAKTNKVINDLNQYDSMVALFKDKYNSLPGDSRVISPSGNNDGNITSYSSPDGTYWSDEIANFWVHLSSVGFLKKSYSATISGGVKSDINVPKILDGGIIATSFPTANINGNIFSLVTGPELYFTILDVNNTTGNYISTPYSTNPTYAGSLSGSIATIIEKKLDNGVWYSGDIITRGFYRSGGAYYSTGCSPTTPKCVLIFKMLSNQR
jgi:prepilin-type N-terminal cleavage/methylation domain-containing protein